MTIGWLSQLYEIITCPCTGFLNFCKYEREGQRGREGKGSGRMESEGWQGGKGKRGGITLWPLPRAYQTCIVFQRRSF